MHFPEPRHLRLLDDRELAKYNLGAALRYLVDKRTGAKAAGLELEVHSRAVAAGMADPDHGGIYVPLAALARDLVVGTPTAGGNLVQTNVPRDSAIHYLRPVSKAVALGATVMSGLQGNVAIPRATSGASVSWVGENSAGSETAPAWDQVSLTPKTCTTYLDIGRRLLLQTGGDVQRMASGDLLAAVGTELDRVAIAGSGTSNQPRGVLYTSGIGSVAGGTNGAAPTYAHAVALEAAVAAANAVVERPAFLTNSAVRAKLELTETFTSSGNPVWASAGDGDVVKGRTAAVSNNVPSNLTKGTSSGVCSALLFGNWPDLIIGLWGEGVTLMVDPYTQSTTGAVRLVVMADVDVAVRYPQSFAAMLDALTA